MQDADLTDISPILKKTEYFCIKMGEQLTNTRQDRNMDDDVCNRGFAELQDLLKNTDKIANIGLKPLLTKLIDYISDTSNRMITIKSIQTISLLAKKVKPDLSSENDILIEPLASLMGCSIAMVRREAKTALQNL
jgi:6-phosphogluconate dehydrogenase